MFLTVLSELQTRESNLENLSSTYAHHKTNKRVKINVAQLYFYHSPRASSNLLIENRFSYIKVLYVIKDHVRVMIKSVIRIFKIGRRSIRSSEKKNNKTFFEYVSLRTKSKNRIFPWQNASKWFLWKNGISRSLDKRNISDVKRKQIFHSNLTHFFTLLIHSFLLAWRLWLIPFFQKKKIFFEAVWALKFYISFLTAAFHMNLQLEHFVVDVYPLFFSFLHFCLRNNAKNKYTNRIQAYTHWEKWWNSLKVVFKRFFFSHHPLLLLLLFPICDVNRLVVKVDFLCMCVMRSNIKILAQFVTERTN